MGGWLVVLGAAGASARVTSHGPSKFPPDPTWVPCFQAVPSGCCCTYQGDITTDCSRLYVPADPGGLCTWVPEEECLVSRCDVTWPEYFECLDPLTGNSCWPDFDPCETHPHCGECWCDQLFDEPCPCDCELVVTDACHEGVCENNTCITMPIDCEEEPPNLCTIDSCDPCYGCWHVPKCWPDDDLCTIDGCDGDSGECQYLPMDCADADPCTIDECHSWHGCLHVAVDPECCDEAGGRWALKCCLSIETYIGIMCALDCEVSTLEGDAQQAMDAGMNAADEYCAAHNCGAHGHPALRHCVASGSLSLALSQNCLCARCIGEDREAYQEDCEDQDERETTRANNNNQHGREGARCWGSHADVDLLPVLDPTLAEVIADCIAKLESGQLDTE
ncbi:MAG: hypothetical protein V2A79_08975 [Planctomycetota bacterium]